jgi:hypothetical protein
MYNVRSWITPGGRVLYEPIVRYFDTLGRNGYYYHYMIILSIKEMRKLCGIYTVLTTVFYIT